MEEQEPYLVTKTLTIGSTTNQRPYGVLTVKETATSTANNTSTITSTLVLKRPSSISSSATKSASMTINGTKYTWSGSIGGSGDKTLLTKTQTVTHNTDGTKTINIAASIALDITWGGVSLGTISNSGTMALTNIPRYATALQSMAAKTETSITMNWSSDSTIDYIWYSTNNGSSWTGINVTDGKSGTYTINGLSANTTYNVKTRVRRKDSQLTTDSAALSITTYAFPYANSMPNLTIGNKLTLGFYNPLNRSITVNILGADNSQISNDTTTGTSISGYNNATVQSRWYNSIPNAKSGTYKVKVTYGSQVSTKTGGTYSINQNICLPTISGVTYQDTNSTTTAITENNQLIISQQSKVQFTATGLSAINGASISSCKLALNGNTYNMSVNGSSASVSNITIDSATNLTGVVTLTDSRGLTATKNVTVTMEDWVLPTAIIQLQRQNNFYSETNLNVNADYSSLNGKNSVTIKARYKKVTDTTYGAYQTLQDGVTTVLNLDNMFEWNVQVVVQDLFGSTTYNLTVGIGLPIIYFDRLLHSVGINCFPVDEKSIESNGISLEKNVMSRSLSAAITNLSVNTYTIIPLNLSNVVGSKLTATNDGGIQIGANVSKILVSGNMAVETVATAGNRHLRIVKNNYSAANTLGWGWDNMQIGDSESITINPQLVDVTEGDVIYLYYYTSNSADTIGGNAYGGRTALTVEVVE